MQADTQDFHLPEELGEEQPEAMMTEDDDLELDEETIERVSDEVAPDGPLDDVWTAAEAVNTVVHDAYDAHDGQTVWDLQPEAYIESADDLPETGADGIPDASRGVFEGGIFEADRDVHGQLDDQISDDTAEAGLQEALQRGEEELDSESDETDDASWA